MALKLLKPLQLGATLLQNRMIMAPLTRMRSAEGEVPGPLAAEYYAQRASAGLIIAEATQVSAFAKGYPGTPGVYSTAQVEGWRKVVEAVHAAGGKIFLQLWHVGRISHSSLRPDHSVPVAPSAVTPAGKTLTATWQQVPYETPRPLTVEEIHAIVEDFRLAAVNAKLAGFDGVELHGANGYLIDQFLEDKTNQRTDEYGGSVENRTRFLLEVLEAVGRVYDNSRIGLRLSPMGYASDMGDSDPKGLFTYVLQRLNELDLAYVHIIEPRATAGEGVEAPTLLPHFRNVYRGVIITAGGYTRESGEETLKAGLADAVAYGRFFIANPDLPTRFATGAELNKYHRETFYGGDAKGYIDYPTLPAVSA